MGFIYRVIFVVAYKVQWSKTPVSYRQTLPVLSTVNSVCFYAEQNDQNLFAVFLILFHLRRLKNVKQLEETKQLTMGTAFQTALKMNLGVGIQTG